MSQKFQHVFLGVLIAVAGSLLHAQQVTYEPGRYPAPRYPEIPQNPALEDLMPVARDIVKRPNIGGSFYPGWAIKPGDRILMMVSREVEPLVIEALTAAIREAGGRVDVFMGDEKRRNRTDGNWDGDGNTEFEYFTYMKDVLGVQTGGMDWPMQVAIAMAGNYNVVLAGDGGGQANFPRDKIRSMYMPWKSVDNFLVSAQGIPPDLLKAVADKAVAMLSRAVRIHVTDPEGTDISWNTKPDEWRFQTGPNTEANGHIMSHQGGVGATGVICGTFNHTGAFPRVCSFYKNDRMEGVEGGGVYGQRWRGLRDRYKDVNYDGKQGPGLFTWLQEAAIGTNPKAARPKGTLEIAMQNIWERTRSGVIHWGIGRGAFAGGGGFYPGQGESTEAKFYLAHPDTPTGHVHIHNYFITMELTNTDGSKSLLIDKGHLTALDDPQVRQEAAKYGDPDKLLQENWIPAIPGINVPGDYFKEYANDPVAWVEKDLKTNWKY